MSKQRPLSAVGEHPSPLVRDIFENQTSREAQRMRADIERVARRPYNILITGETGTGKTEIARQIHRMSARAGNAFVELNCANLPEHLVEAELFGHRRGAFTGADRDRIGLFEEADGGILLLDEIGDVPPSIQNRLLKAIEEKQIKRLGSNNYKFYDVQIIAATSRNLQKMIRDSEFREDLYCRLAVLTVETCPLRERREDIPAIVRRTLQEASNVNGSQIDEREEYRIDEDALALLCELDYRGNIRSLRNLVYELTSYIEDNEPISSGLVQASLARLRAREVRILSMSNRETSFRSNPRTNSTAPAIDNRDIGLISHPFQLRSIAKEGDIILPIELCVLRRGETFKQWTARAKRDSIEATRVATGGTLQTVAERLGLTAASLKSHLRRARRLQKKLFD